MGYTSTETIFCISENKELRTFLEELAPLIRSTIYYADPCSPDILAIPRYVLIIDRNLMSKEMWDYYLRYREEVEETEPCLLVDQLSDLDCPARGYTLCLDLSKSESFDIMKSLITELRVQSIYKVARADQ